MLITDEIRRRLEALNRDRLRRGLGSSGSSDSASGLASAGAVFSRCREEIAGEVVKTESGEFLLVRRELAEIWRGAERFVSHYCLVFKRGAIAVDPASLHPDLQQVCQADPCRLLYLDIETCGLSSAPVFLIGMLYLEGERMLIDQLLARDYEEEAPILEFFWANISRFDGIVTFNGKSFDLPFLKDRASYHRIEVEAPQMHFDLLHEARRRWRGVFPDCRLQTLEARVCRRLRSGDIPGSLIPRAYHEFVRSKDPGLVREIIEHNALDLVTMSEVLVSILSG